MLELTTEELQLLLECALMGVGQNHFQSAAQVLDALEQFRPGHPSLDTARAVMLLSQHHSQEALDFIEKAALQRHPDNDLLQVFRGTALVQLNRREEARGLLQSLQSSQDVNAANLSRGLLETL